jgi:hypothetical protein
MPSRFSIKSVGNPVIDIGSMVCSPARGIRDPDERSTDRKALHP